MKRRPGRVVITNTGRVGIVYSDLEPINGKLRVKIIAESYEALAPKDGKSNTEVKPPENILAAPESLKVIGLSD